MAWHEYSCDSWEALRDCLHAAGDHAGLSCRGDPTGTNALLSSIDRHFQEARVPIERRPALERCALDRFISQGWPSVPDASRFNLDDPLLALMLMRHFGGPTRLLDWTESPWIAAFFAVRRCFDRDGLIWIFDRYCLGETVHRRFSEQTQFVTQPREAAPDYPGVFFPDLAPRLDSWIVNLFQERYRFPRLIVQQGHFTIGSQLALDHAVAIDELLTGNVASDAPSGSRSFYRIKIRAGAKQRCLQSLAAMGISSATLLPGVEGLCESLTEFVCYGAGDRGVQRIWYPTSVPGGAGG